MSRFGEWLRRETMTEPGTEVSIQPQVDQFWSELRQTGFFSPRLIERVWVAARCIQLNAQQVASMPLRYQGPFEPAWVSNPDPVWYPNGLADAMFAAVRSFYGWGDAFLLITSRYATGFPATWTVLDPAEVNVVMVDGRKRYRMGVQTEFLPANDVVQISRDPGGGLRGTSALRAYSSQAWSQIGAGTSSQNIQGGGTVPPVALRPKKKVTKDQAEAMQAQWVAARARYGGGVPAVLSVQDFDDPFVLNINPKDLALLELAEYDARVIATAFGVPSFMLNLAMSGSLVYQNPAMLGEFWWRFELRPAAKRFADAFSAQMLPRGQFVWFDAADTFLPLNSIADEDVGLLASRLGLAVQYGVLSPEEARAKLAEAGIVLSGVTPPVAGESQTASASPSQNVTPLRPAQTGGKA